MRETSVSAVARGRGRSRGRRGGRRSGRPRRSGSRSRRRSGSAAGGRWRGSRRRGRRVRCWRWRSAPRARGSGRRCASAPPRSPRPGASSRRVGAMASVTSFSRTPAGRWRPGRAHRGRRRPRCGGWGRLSPRWSRRSRSPSTPPRLRRRYAQGERTSGSGSGPFDFAPTLPRRHYAQGERPNLRPGSRSGSPSTPRRLRRRYAQGERTSGSPSRSGRRRGPMRPDIHHEPRGIVEREELDVVTAR